MSERADPSRQTYADWAYTHAGRGWYPTDGEGVIQASRELTDAEVLSDFGSSSQRCARCAAAIDKEDTESE